MMSKPFFHTLTIGQGNAVRRQVLCAFVTLCSVISWAQKTIVVENPTSSQRSELVAISAEQLGIKPRTKLIVRDVFDIEQPTQWTYDGRLLMSVYVKPNGKTSFTIQQGTPEAFERSWVSGRMYPERLEDIAFENDRIGFRLYGPALQKRGERGFGHDVWVKRTTELILDKLYRDDPRLNFHLDHGLALDCYGVGPSLGCGTPCLMKEGKIVYPWCYETYKILDKGPLRFTVQVNFPTIDGITEHRILSLDKGSNFCEATVWFDGVSKPTDIAAGLAIRPADPNPVVIGKDYVHYADPTVDPERHQFQIYSALLFPDTKVIIKQQENHALGVLKNYQEGQRFHYFFGAAWSEFDVRSQAEWQLRIDGFMQARQQPLKVTIQ
jgi:hypothetical protein